MPSAIRKIYIEESEEELLAMRREDVTEGMTDKEQRFCEYYCRSFNIITSAVRAGYSQASAHIVGYKIRRKYLVNRYICWLKLRTTHEFCIQAADIIDMYIRIGFADITDFASVNNGRLKLKDGLEMDGQLIKTIKQGKDGVQLELYDKLSALDKLERYFDVMPNDWKQKVEERKLELLEQRLELDRLKAGQFDQDDSDDGFLDALRDTAKEVWEG